MRITCYIVAVISSAFLCSNVVLAADRTGTSDGTFAGIEQGDYAHLLLKTRAAEPESFFIMKVDKSVKSYIDNPKELKGRRIRVHWREQKQNIPEAGGPMTVKVVQRVEARK